MTTIISSDSGVKLERFGTAVFRYGLVIVLLWVGLLKFSAYEAEGVHMFASNSPLLSWLSGAMSVQGFSILLGLIEITLGILIATSRFTPKLLAFGSLGAIFQFLVTLTFVLSTPGVWQPGYGFPFLSPNPGLFLAKDILPLGAAIYTAGEALIASQNIHYLTK